MEYIEPGPLLISWQKSLKTKWIELFPKICPQFCKMLVIITMSWIPPPPDNSWCRCCNRPSWTDVINKSLPATLEILLPTSDKSQGKGIPPSSSSVAAISWIAFGAKPFFCKYLISGPCTRFVHKNQRHLPTFTCQHHLRSKSVGYMALYSQWIHLQSTHSLQSSKVTNPAS